MKTYPLCIYCKHYKGDLKCKAFSNGIPKDILSRSIYHTQSIDGDNGIEFEVVDGMEKKDLFRLGFSIY
jgi:hypothetical protein